MISVHRALFLSVAERYVLIAISLASNILLARLLTPEEIGIYSVSLAIIGIVQVLRDFGIGNFLIQEKNLTEAHIRTAFGISLVIGSTLAVAVYLAAPMAEIFYQEPRVLETMRISAINFMTLPFCTVSMALLRREMVFTRMITVTLTATTIGFAVSITLASAGQGPNSMAIGAVVSNLVTGMGAWLARTSRQLLLPSFSEWRALLKFGAQSSITNIVTSIAMDINDLVLGKILGFAPVAIVSRAQGLTNLFHRDLMAAIRNVAYPAFAKAHREGEPIEERYIDSVAAVTVFAWPFYGFTALYALEIIRLMFGTQWDAAVHLVPVYCCAGAVAATSNLLLNAVMAVGRNDLVMKAELLFQPIRALLIITAALIYQSLLSCAVAYLIAFTMQTPLLYFFKSNCIPNNYWKLLADVSRSAAVTLVALAVPCAIAIQAGIGRQEPVSLVLLAVSALLCAICWLVALIIFKHPLVLHPISKRIIDRLPFCR